MVPKRSNKGKGKAPAPSQPSPGPSGRAQKNRVATRRNQFPALRGLPALPGATGKHATRVADELPEHAQEIVKGTV